jgi:Na+/proline symporter
VKAAFYIIAFVLAALRIAGHRSEAYQAAAHLFVGGLIAAAFVQIRLSQRINEARLASEVNKSARRNFWLAVALSVVEVACFIAFRLG